MKKENDTLSGLDGIDEKILSLLRENARLTFTEIGKAAGISRVAVVHRVERLEKCGIIRGYHADIDRTSVPGGIRFTLDIEASPGSYEDVVETLAGSSMLHEIYGTSGECHIHAAGIAPNSQTLGSYARYLFRTARGVRRLNWRILVTTYKDTGRGVDYVRYQESEYMEEGREEHAES